MKTLVLASAAALLMSGSAYAYQSYSTPHATHTTTATTVVDPGVVFVTPAGWTAEERALWQEQMAYHPGWTAAQIAAFEAMMAIPPASWTPEQQALYTAHLGHIPADWTAAERAAFASMVEPLHTPWMSATTTAAVDTTGTTTTYAAAPASGGVVQPSNADPEHDARGIAVISDVAYVPPGYNGTAATAVGGPVEGDDESYPPCTAQRTDNCIQLYERGVRASLASYTATSGGLDRSYTGVGGPDGEDEVGDNTREDDALDVDVKPDGSLDVDGDLDNDGDNDIE